MKEVQVKFNQKIWILNDNSGKLSRIPKLFNGKWPSPEIIMAYYDKSDGLILDENRQKVENGQFWKMYQEREERMEKRKVFFKHLDRITRHPIISSLILIAIIAAIFYLFHIDLSRFN